MKSMLEMAKTMPFARENSAANLEEEDIIPSSESISESSNEEESEKEEDRAIVTPQQYQQIVERNRMDSAKFLVSLGIPKLTMKKGSAKRKLDSSVSATPRKRTVRTLPVLDLDEYDSENWEEEGEESEESEESEEKEEENEGDGNEEEKEEEKEKEKERDCCEDCPYKRRVAELEIMLQKRLPSDTMRAAGVFADQDAAGEKMVPLLPGSNVFIPVQVKTIVLSGATSRSDMATKLLRAFYSKAEMKVAKSLSKLRDSEEIISAITACCLRLKSEVLKLSTPRKIKKALFNAMDYDKRESTHKTTRKERSGEKSTEAAGQSEESQI